MWLDAFFPGDPSDRLVRRHFKIDKPVGKAGADGDLVHIDVRRVEQAAPIGQRDHGKGVRQVFRADRRSLQRIERDVDLRSLAGADLLADEEHRRLVALALADHHLPANPQPVQLIAHGVDGCLVGGFLVAASPHHGGGDGGAFGDTHQFQCQDPVHHFFGGSHANPFFTQLGGVARTAASDQSRSMRIRFGFAET